MAKRELTRSDVLDCIDMLSWFARDLAEDVQEAEWPPPVELRERCGIALRFAETINGGESYERHRRVAMVYYLTRDARDSGVSPTDADVAGWPLLPARYRDPEVVQLLVLRPKSNDRFA